MVLVFTQQQQMDAAAAAYAAAQRQAMPAMVNHMGVLPQYYQYHPMPGGAVVMAPAMAPSVPMVPYLPPAGNTMVVVTNPNVLAERYKTKMCRSFMTTGSCAYHHRCMFAHGEDELRTTDMNVRDGLITEEAIRSFQRAMTATNRGELVNGVHATIKKEGEAVHHIPSDRSVNKH